MLDEHTLTNPLGHEDVKCLGYMMVELMEVKTSILHPRSIELRAPEAWEDSTGIKSFLIATQQESLTTLTNVSIH